MRTRLVLAASAAAVVLAGCGSTSSTASAPTTTSPAALASTSPPTTVAAKAVTAQVFSPEKGSIQGVSGSGMVVDLAFRSKDAALLAGTFRLGGALPDPAAPVKPGRLDALPGLVVTLSTTGDGAGGPTANLANLFQIVSVSRQADGSAEVWATWTNAKPGFGIDVDTVLDAYLVRGDAPDKVPADRAGLDVVSNLINVPFHLAGPKPAA